MAAPNQFRQDVVRTQALAEIEPEIQASDQTWRRRYLRDYHEAFRSYEKVLDLSALERLIASASLILVGDYHALPECQTFVADLMRTCARIKHVPIVLAVEAIFSRDQHILDEWWGGQISEQELRERIRFDLDWGYEWTPFYELLSTARQHAETVFGLDCMPREDLRRIRIRDRHAAHKLVEIRERHPGAVIIAFVGESHLAPAHLPAQIKKHLSGERRLTVLQNVDAIYAGTTREETHVPAVRVNEDTVCVFNSTPLEKYASYRICLDRWREDTNKKVDFAPVVYNLIDRVALALGIDRYSSHNGTQPRFLVDSLPEVYDTGTSEFRTLLSRQNLSREKIKRILRRLNERKCLYLPQFNVFAVEDWRFVAATEEAARFVHHACQGLYLFSKNDKSEIREQDRPHIEMAEEALVDFASHILCRIEEVMPSESENTLRDSELSMSPGRALGAALYQAYLQGPISRQDIKRLFLFPVCQPGKAAELCSQPSRRFRVVL